MKPVFLITLIVLINMIIFSQDITYVTGKVICISQNDSEEPQRDITVLIENTGDRDKTDQNGLFKINLNKKFKAGDKVIFAIEKEGWVIQYPLFGEDRLPSDPDKDLIKIRITQKGSPLLIDEDQLDKYIDYYINRKLADQNSLILGNVKPDLESLIFKLSKIYGFTAGEWLEVFNKYFNTILSDTSGLYEKGVVEFARENYDQAAALFVRSAENRIDKFRLINQDIFTINQKRIDLIKETTRDLRLAGESYFEAKNFDSSIIEYSRALEFIDYSEDWEEYVLTLNRIASCYYYLTYKSYGYKKIQQIDSAMTYLNIGLELAQKKSLVEWEWKFIPPIKTNQKNY
jgi:tetratricopeptide (TPR) repeat protein